MYQTSREHLQKEVWILDKCSILGYKCNYITIKHCSFQGLDLLTGKARHWCQVKFLSGQLLSINRCFTKYLSVTKLRDFPPFFRVYL